MAIVLDRKVVSAPVIQSRIEDSGRITGRFGQQESNDLALVLRAGALPASIRYLEERTVGPSLGADSIRHGVQASVISLMVVLIFMVFYYRLSGVNAVVALLLNLVILLAALAYFRRGAHAARNCGGHSDHRYGRGFQCADLRTHPRGIASGEGAGFGRGYGLQAGIFDDHRYARNHRGFSRFPLCIRDGAGAGFCRDPDHRVDCEPIYSGLRIAGDL